MEKRKVVSLALSGMLIIGLLSGCGLDLGEVEKVTGADSTESPVVGESREIVEFEKQYFEQYEEVPEVRVYEPGEHVFFIRYYHATLPGNISEGSVVVPDGYRIKEIENFNEHVESGSATGGIDVWYENIKTVRVEPVFKDEYTIEDRKGYFDYANFGTIIELEQNEEASKTLTK